LEEAIGALEGGHSVAFASGMGAISAVFALLPAGSRILAPTDCYQGVTAVLDDGVARLGWTVTRIDNDDAERWLTEVATKPNLVWLESPSNPLLVVADVPAIVGACRSHGVVSAVDATFATPLLLKPLEHGATCSVHSATKFIGGHSDLLGGMVSTGSDRYRDQIERQRTLGGATMGSLEAFLALRGLRTLPVRLERAQHSASELAARLLSHRNVKVVHYPGLTSHPTADVARSTMPGPGAMLSFETVGDGVGLDQAMNDLNVIVTATSLGAVETTAERRARVAGQDHLPATLVRLSVGCEHVEDLWDDLSAMLDRLG
jgi:cystathionine gamma-synthase